MDVATWLKQHGYERYSTMFEQHDIHTLELLRRLTSNDLKAMGVASLGQRKRLLNAIAGLSVPKPLDPVGRLASTGEETVAERRGGEWRQITVMFCDLVDSTAMSIAVDLEDYQHLLNTYRNICEAVIRRFDGHLAKYMGDGILTYFGYPRAHEGDPERAVRAALETIVRLRQCQDRPDLKLRAHIGIATGLVVVGDVIGTGTARELNVVGQTPNLAARLLDLAGPTKWSSRPETRRQTGGFSNSPTPVITGSRGFPSRCKRGGCWACARSRAVRGDPRTAELTPLTGRDDELDTLVGRWHRARAGEGQVVLLSGEPGIGKSRLSQALRRRLSDGSCASVGYYCSPYHQNSTLFPLIDKLGRAARFSGEDGRRRS